MQDDEKLLELLFGLLWMKEEHQGTEADAYYLLCDRLDKDQKKRGIQAAISLGYEAEHPEGATYWAGKKGD